MKRLSIIAALIVLAGCEGLVTRVDAVYLQHADTGEIVRCGPYARVAIPLIDYTMPLFLETLLKERRGCIDDFRAQGYLRVERPPASN